MSFEGYCQRICEAGHYYTMDCYDVDTGCPICGKSVKWEHVVDLTNGSWDEDENRIDGYIELAIDTEEIWCECICGNRHIHTVATYKTPEDSKVGTDAKPLDEANK